MKVYFDEETDKRLLEAQTEEEVRAIIAGTADAGKLADKIDLVMAELAKIKGGLDEELDLDELDSAAGGAKLKRVDLSETQGCIATFSLADYMDDMNSIGGVCWSNDYCDYTNEYDYHYTKWSNCSKGGKHDWEYLTDSSARMSDYKCRKCGLRIVSAWCNFNK